MLEKENNLIEKHYFEKSNQNCHKFYEISQDNTKIMIIYGRIGTNGRTSEKIFESSEKANHFRENIIKKKVKGGYKLAVKGWTPPRRLGKVHPGQLAIKFLS